ncbi:HIT domain-containing protein [Cardiobacteriaceae bacterium TAE3-ERU3]|nr:HIT domain-containing protein [Cardiobacteriaceae bacterium TAE3-ERU3]
MSIFTDMMAGKISAVTVVEDEQHIAFMEPNPNARGHIICLPKAEVQDLFAMPKADYDALMAFTRRVATALQSA